MSKTKSVCYEVPTSNENEYFKNIETAGIATAKKILMSYFTPTEKEKYEKMRANRK